MTMNLQRTACRFLNNDTLCSIEEETELWKETSMTIISTGLLINENLSNYLFSSRAVLGKVTFKSNALQYCVTP